MHIGPVRETTSIRRGWSPERTTSEGKDRCRTQRKAAAVVGGLATVPLAAPAVCPHLHRGRRAADRDIRGRGRRGSLDPPGHRPHRAADPGAQYVAGADQVEIEGPAFARFLFGNRRGGPALVADPPVRRCLLAARPAGTSSPAPAGSMAVRPSGATGTAAVAIPDQGRRRPSRSSGIALPQLPAEQRRLARGSPRLITFGEMAVGLGLLLGAADRRRVPSSARPMKHVVPAGGLGLDEPGIMAMLALLVILAWKVAGYYGLDRWSRSILGTPWKPGKAATARPHNRPPRVKDGSPSLTTIDPSRLRGPGRTARAPASPWDRDGRGRSLRRSPNGRLLGRYDRGR